MTIDDSSRVGRSALDSLHEQTATTVLYLRKDPKVNRLEAAGSG